MRYPVQSTATRIGESRTRWAAPQEVSSIVDDVDAGPAELLAVAFAACLMKNIEHLGKLMGFGYETADVTVIARRQDTPPQSSNSPTKCGSPPTDLTDESNSFIRTFAIRGTVYNTLTAVCEINGNVLVKKRRSSQRRRRLASATHIDVRRYFAYAAAGEVRRRDDCGLLPGGHPGPNRYDRLEGDFLAHLQLLMHRVRRPIGRPPSHGRCPVDLMPVLPGASSQAHHRAPRHDWR